MSADVKQAVVAGGPDDFLTLRHVRVEGSQREIGRALAEEALARFPATEAVADPALQRARRRWVEQCWPEHFARMEGFADARGVDVHDDDVDLVELVAMPLRPGCSVVWCPPSSSTDGRARLARNFDFRTDSVLDVIGMPSGEVHPPTMSAPYVIESSPTDRGLASVVLGACDLSGCFEGINEAGLVVALLADDETDGLRPALGYQAGLNESQIGRFLLDRCNDVDEALEALRTTKQYDALFTCHYVIADRHGGAFVWERDTHNAEHVVRAGEGPLCVTNYLLHRYGSVDALPEDDPRRPDGLPFTVGMYERARVLDRATMSTPLRETDLWAAIDEVALPTAVPGARTLWQTMFDPEGRSMTIRCYLGDGDDPAAAQRRSPPLTFALDPSRVSSGSRPR